jgi:hypothetical protein
MAPLSFLLDLPKPFLQVGIQRCHSEKITYLGGEFEEPESKLEKNLEATNQNTLDCDESEPGLAKFCMALPPLSGPAVVIPSSRTSFRGNNGNAFTLTTTIENFSHKFTFTIILPSYYHIITTILHNGQTQITR